MKKTSQLCELAIDGAVARILLNHPPLNILTDEMRRMLLDHVTVVEKNRKIRVVIFQATDNGAFSVGSDLKQFPQDELGGRQKIQSEQFFLDRVERLEAITIAQLGGYVLGGGAELMLAADLRIASEEAQFGFPEVKVGGFPAAGGVWRLVRDVGPVRARELLFFGKVISAEAAVHLGLINECVPRERLEQRLDRMVKDLLELPQSSLLAIKRTAALVAAGSDRGIDSRTTDEYGRLFEQPDIHEGIEAFLEKRPPKFNRARKSDARSRPRVSRPRKMGGKP